MPSNRSPGIVVGMPNMKLDNGMDRSDERANVKTKSK